MNGASIDIWQMIGGIGLFLFAMSELESALKKIASRRLRQSLRDYTGNPVNGVLVGTVSTALLQSSSLVGLLVLAFVGASIMSLQNALGVIFGANLGTTVTGWLVATIGFKLNLGNVALPLIGLGSLALVGLKGHLSTLGRLVAAIGFLLMGISLMKDGVSDVSTSFDLDYLADLPAWKYLAIGVVFAAVVQSSSAVMMVTLAALNSSIIELPSAAAIAVGADLGTTSTVLLGALQGAAAKKRVALAHFLFNATTTVVAFSFLAPLLGLVRGVGIQDPLYSLVAFHSVFNFLGIVIFLPIIVPFSRFLDRRFTSTVRAEALYVSQTVPDVAEAGLAAVTGETAHIISRVISFELKAFTPPLVMSSGRLPVELPTEPIGQRRGSSDDRYRRIKRLEGEILRFSLDIQKEQLAVTQTSLLTELLSSVRQSVRSAKAIKDIYHNLNDFVDSPKNSLNQYADEFRRRQSTFFDSVFELRASDTEGPIAQDFPELMKLIQALHDQMNAKLYEDIHQDRLQEDEISTVLNVNRELKISNEWLVGAIETYYRATEWRADPAAAEAAVAV